MCPTAYGGKLCVKINDPHNPRAGPSLRAMWPGAVGLFDFTVVTDIYRILRLSSSARGKSKEILRSAKVPGQI